MRAILFIMISLLALAAFNEAEGSCVFDTSAVATNSGCAITQYSGMICMGYQKDDCGENNPIYPCCKWIDY